MTELSDLVGSSAVMRELRSAIESVAPFDEPVLILGETGTGKELVARAIHTASPRNERPLQIVHCAGLGGDILAAELFGHAAGSFTGATRSREGRIRAADGSSLVLDELTESPAAVQAALLRAIEYGEVQPVGRDRPLRTDVRFLATSNRSFDELNEGECLRQDLFHRLAGFVLRIPPLRGRREDIDELARHFLDQLAAQYGAERDLSEDAAALLATEPFPGNVRQLRQVMLRAYAASSSEELQPEDLTDALDVSIPADRGETSSGVVALESVVRRHIRKVLTAADGNLSRAARLLEIPRSTLQHYLVKYDVEPATSDSPGRAATG